MIDVMENIKKLSAALDAETASLHPSGKLLLLGSQDSVFLKAIKRKADQLGINCDHTSNPLPPYRGIVVDSETVSFNSILDPDVDIDHSYSPGMSAVSQAVMDLLIESGLVWEKDITIVGRGHAVKELAKYLDFNNATVTVAHSKTKSLLQATQNRDVVIYATPIKYGLGFIINVSSARGRTAVVFGAIIVIMLFSFVFDKLGNLLIRKIFQWRYCDDQVE